MSLQPAPERPGNRFVFCGLRAPDAALKAASLPSDDSIVINDDVSFSYPKSQGESVKPTVSRARR